MEKYMGKVSESEVLNALKQQNLVDSKRYKKDDHYTDLIAFTISSIKETWDKYSYYSNDKDFISLVKTVAIGYKSAQNSKELIANTKDAVEVFEIKKELDKSIQNKDTNNWKYFDDLQNKSNELLFRSDVQYFRRYVENHYCHI